MIKSKTSKFILFFLGGDYYALPLSAGCRFADIGKITRIPAAKSIAGLVYNDGQIVTLINTANLLSLKKSKEPNIVLFFNFENEPYGLLADAGGESVRAKRVFYDRQRKQFNKYIKIKDKKIYILEPKEILEILKIL